MSRKPASRTKTAGTANRTGGRGRADRTTRTAHRPGWTLVRQHGDAWLEHDTCRRTFYQAIDQRHHEETCR